MNHSAADVLRWLLILLGQGSDPSLQDDWPVYVSDEPDLPDNAITTFDTSGTLDGRSMIDGDLWDHYGCQVRLRSATYVAGRDKAQDVRAALASAVNRTVTINTEHYTVQCLSQIGQVLSLGKDSPSGNRNLFTINALLTVKHL